ncbi:phage tail tube protein [Acetivibrio ethanolgignens]|nr:phage tail tube protein [Acetivibrio ethanolgignens]
MFKTNLQFFADDVMEAKDAVSAKLAKCYVTIEGNRYLLMQAKSFEANFKKNKKTVSILGKTGEGNKASGWSGSGKMVIYHNTELFNDLLERYKNTGEDIYFDVQVTNEDPTSAAGRNTKIYKNCNLDEGTLQSFDAAGEWLEQEVSFTFEDYEGPEKYKQLAGMQ